MPFIITAPETKVVQQIYLIDGFPQDVASTRTLDHVNIESILINTPINNPYGVTATIKWSIGYEDGGVFFPISRGSTDFAGSSLITAMMQPPTGDSHYADLKLALYGLLVAAESIPAGSVV